MSAKTIAILVLTSFCAAGTGLGLFLIPKGPASSPVETRPILFAAADVSRGETVVPAMIEIRQVPVDQAHPSGMGKAEDAVNRTVHVPMLKGDVVTEAKLSPKGSGVGLAALIRPGMRAFTILTPTLSSSLAGLLLPGNRVDVLFTLGGPGSSEDRHSGVTTTLLQNIEVLAVHTTVNSPATNKIDPNEARSVTLLVSPDQASLLDLGQIKGTLHLTLRNPRDEGDQKSKPATMVDIGIQRPTAPAQPLPTAPAPPLPPTVVERTIAIRTLRGTVPGEQSVTFLAPSTAPPSPTSRVAGRR